jgi:multidrug efflux system membrane fusion protein
MGRRADDGKRLSLGWTILPILSRISFARNRSCGHIRTLFRLLLGIGASGATTACVQGQVMQIKQSHLVAAGILGFVLLLFVVVGPLLSMGAEKKKAEQPKAAANSALLVTTQLIEPQMRPSTTLLRGRTEANRAVVVRAETAGPVIATPTPEGSFVRKGTILCRISVDARQASVDQARANLKSRQLQKQASERLAAQGYRSQTQVLQDQANLDSAQASVRAAEVLLEQVNVRAPFSGVFDRRDAEVGTYLSPGAACGSMIELSPLLIVVDIPERLTGQFRVGDVVSATLSSGDVLSGRVRSMARDADAQTRTYRVEIQAPNPGLRARSGVSADVRVTSGAAPAHLIPPAALVLGSDGRQGVRHVVAGNKVAFIPVEVMDETPEGVWVRGIDGPIQLITVGQSFVGEGQSVRTKATAR